VVCGLSPETSCATSLRSTKSKWFLGTRVGAQPEPNAQLGAGELALFDKLAELTRAPDSTFERMRSAYASDDRLRVPPQVFNAIRQRLEEVPELQTASA
jgi:hypothetical protein